MCPGHHIIATIQINLFFSSLQEFSLIDTFLCLSIHPITYVYTFTPTPLRIELSIYINLSCIFSLVCIPKRIRDTHNNVQSGKKSLKQHPL